MSLVLSKMAKSFGHNVSVDKNFCQFFFSLNYLRCWSRCSNAKTLIKSKNARYTIKITNFHFFYFSKKLQFFFISKYLLFIFFSEKKNIFNIIRNLTLTKGKKGFQIWSSFFRVERATPCGGTRANLLMEENKQNARTCRGNTVSLYNRDV